MRARTAAVLTLALLLARTLPAQSSLSLQGFGYPIGQLSIRSLATGGALAEIDPSTPINPAAVGRWGRSGLAAQFLPEFRSVRGPDGSDDMSTMRFPLIAAGINLATRWMAGLSSSTLLDRSWSSEFESTEVLDGEEVKSFTRWVSQGAINDIGISLSYGVTPALQLGVGLHLITGSNRIAVATDFENEDFSDLSVNSSISYTGSGASAGLLWTPSDALTFGASARLGGDMSAHLAGQETTTAKVPARFGASLAFTGLPGTTLAARFEKVSFSDMNGLGSEAATARDTDDIGFGAELSGPSIFGNASLLRIGVRRRNLPYDAADLEVRENSFSAGIGLPLARGRVSIDLGALRLTRSNDSAYRESAWIFGTGILVRP